MSGEQDQVDSILCNITLNLHLSVVVQTAVQQAVANVANKIQIAAQSVSADVQFGASKREYTVAAAQIFDDVAWALRHFHHTPQLAKSPLVRLVNSKRPAPPGESPMLTPGLALKQLLDDVITGVSGIDAGQRLTPSQWRMDHYLHLRYRNGIQHKALAAHLGYTERHLLRLRRELIMDAAELILGQSR